MKILVAGDFCPQDRVAKILEEGDYASVFGDVKAIVSQADYSIVNLECPVVVHNGTPIEKCGPNLKATVKGVDALRWTGFNCVSLANNHFYDYGDEGVKSTLEACADLGIDTVGGGHNLVEASKVLYKQLGGQTLAIINCCEREFSIATETTGGSNPLNPIQQYYAIQEAKALSDYILVIVHGGKEHWQLPSPRMVETYRFFIDAGADAVVNHHQHCYSGYEVYQGKPIFYGLGNFCFDNHVKRNGIWNKGYFAKLDTDRLSEFEIIPYSQCDNEPSVILCGKEAFNENIFALNAIINNDERLNNEYERLLASLEGFYKAFMAPYSGRWSRALLKRGLLPSFLSKKRKLALYDFIGCESHVDFILNLLKK